LNRVRIKLLGLGIALATSSIFITAPSAQAENGDIGDGLLACSVGEICWKKNVDRNWTQYVKHFWWGDSNHDDDNFSGGGGTFGENASMFWIRDTEKCVDLKDDQPWPLPQRSLVLGRYSGYTNFGDSWNDENDRHYRVVCP
jgi:transposase